MRCECGHEKVEHYIEIVQVVEPAYEQGGGVAVIAHVQKSRRGPCGRCDCGMFREEKGEKA